MTIFASVFRSATATPHPIYTTPLTNTASQTVTHNLGRKPMVEVLDDVGLVITDVVNINHISDNSFLVTSNEDMTGVIRYF